MTIAFVKDSVELGSDGDGVVSVADRVWLDLANSALTSEGEGGDKGSFSDTGDALSSFGGWRCVCGQLVAFHRAGLW